MPKTTLIIDGHVHIYDCYDLDKFFDSAIKNLDKSYSSINPVNNNFQRILLLTESKDNDYFSQFKKNDNLGRQSEYRFGDTEEDCSIILSKNNQPLCCLIAGRPIVTKEKLEVLSLASNQI